MEPQAVMDARSRPPRCAGAEGRVPDGPQGVAPGEEPASPVYLVVNADESEPGAFKDRDVMRHTPPTARGLPHHCPRDRVRVSSSTSGACTSSRSCGRPRRGTQGEAPRRRDDRPPSWRRRLHLRRGDRAPRVARGQARTAAATAAVPAGERALRRADPDQQRQTIALVPRFLELGAAEFAKIGVPSAPGTAVFSLSGNVAEPGNYERPLGTTPAS